MAMGRMGRAGSPTPQESSDLFALLAALSDPAACKERLEELTAAQAVISTAEAEMQRLHADAVAKLAEAEKMNAEADEAMKVKLPAAAEAEAKAKALVAEYERKTADLDKRQTEFEAQATDAGTALAQRQDMFAKWENSLSYRDKQLEADRAVVDVLKAEYEAKLADFRRIAG